MPKDELKSALNHPITWSIGGLLSVVAVISTLFTSPGTVIGGLLGVFSAQAMNIFTASSIAGFTLAPEFQMIPAWPFKILAIVSGTAVVFKIADGIWDAIERRVL